MARNKRITPVEIKSPLHTEGDFVFINKYCNTNVLIIRPDELTMEALDDKMTSQGDRVTLEDLVRNYDAYRLGEQIFLAVETRIVDKKQDLFPDATEE